MQQHSRCRLCGDRDDWVGKVIYWELCKMFKFDHTNKWYLHNPMSVLENETHKLLWDFEIYTHYLILARRQDLMTVTKTENLLYSGLGKTEDMPKEREKPGPC